MKRAVKYSGKLSYEETSETLEDLGQIDISTKSIWRLVQRWGQVMKKAEQEEDRRANHSIEEARRQEAGQREDPRMGVSMDGTMINIRGEGWKELKVGCIFEVEQKPVFDVGTKEWDDQA